MNTLQTQQTELKKARAAGLRGSKAKALGGRIRLTTCECADKQACEMTGPLLRRGSCGEREEGDEEFVERQPRVGDEPVSSAHLSGQDVANVASQASAELKAMRRRTLAQVSKRQNLVAWSTLQALQLIVADRSCWPKVFDGVGCHLHQCCLLYSRAVLQHSLTEIDHGRTSEITATILSTCPLGK